MSLDAFYNTLGQSVIPQIFGAVLPDTCTITTESTSAGTGGGRVKSGTTDAYTSVPCAYEPGSGARFTSADKLVSTNVYTVTMPTHQSSSRINLDMTKDRLIVAARGNEPAKTFRPISVKDDLGAIFEVICEREN